MKEGCVRERSLLSLYHLSFHQGNVTLNNSLGRCSR